MRRSSFHIRRLLVLPISMTTGPTVEFLWALWWWIIAKGSGPHRTATSIVTTPFEHWLWRGSIVIAACDLTAGARARRVALDQRVSVCGGKIADVVPVVQMVLVAVVVAHRDRQGSGFPFTTFFVGLHCATLSDDAPAAVVVLTVVGQRISRIGQVFQRCVIAIAEITQARIRLQCRSTTRQTDVTAACFLGIVRLAVESAPLEFLMRHGGAVREIA